PRLSQRSRGAQPDNPQGARTLFRIGSLDGGPAQENGTVMAGTDSARRSWLTAYQDRDIGHRVQATIGLDGRTAHRVCRQNKGSFPLVASNDRRTGGL